MAEYLTNTADLTAVADAIRTKGGTTDPLIYPDGFVAAIESIQAGGGANELLEWFGGSKYYTTTVTPTSNTERITITPDDATILSSPKFLLVIPDIPSARNVVRTRAIARAPSPSGYAAGVIAFSIGGVAARLFAQIENYGESGGTTYSYIDTAGGDVFVYQHGIWTDDGKTLNVDFSMGSGLFKGGQPYKVLLIG